MKIKVKLITKFVHPAICLFIVVASWKSSGSPLGLGVLLVLFFCSLTGFAAFSTAGLATAFATGFATAFAFAAGFAAGVEDSALFVLSSNPI